MRAAQDAQLLWCSESGAGCATAVQQPALQCVHRACNQRGSWCSEQSRRLRGIQGPGCTEQFECAYGSKVQVLQQKQFLLWLLCGRLHWLVPIGACTPEDGWCIGISPTSSGIRGQAQCIKRVQVTASGKRAAGACEISPRHLAAGLQVACCKGTHLHIMQVTCCRSTQSWSGCYVQMQQKQSSFSLASAGQLLCPGQALSSCATACCL